MEIIRSRRIAHPLDAVVAMVLDPEAHVATYRFMGHRDIEVRRVVRESDALEIEIERRVEVAVPEMAARFVRPVNTVRSSDRWERHADGSCTGRSDVDIRGVPVASVGTARIEPAEDGDPGATHYEIGLTLAVQVPVIGPRVARVMRGQLERQIDAQLDAAEHWLDSRLA